MFFVIREKSFRTKQDYVRAKTLISKSHKYQMIRKIYGALMVLTFLGGLLFLLSNPRNIRFMEILIPAILLVLIYSYTSVLKQYPQGETVANTLEQEIGASIKRGIVGGIVFSIIIAIFLILYFLYLLYVK